MLDTRGFLAETNATHVFIVRNSDKSRASGDLATSHVVACPEGITRATVIEICAAEKIRCIETDLSLVDIYGANEMFCTGTMGELAAVTRLDNRAGWRWESRPDDKTPERPLRQTDRDRRGAGCLVAGEEGENSQLPNVQRRTLNHPNQTVSVGC